MPLFGVAQHLILIPYFLENAVAVFLARPRAHRELISDKRFRSSRPSTRCPQTNH